MRIERQEQGRSVRHNVGVLSRASVQRVSPCVKSCSKLRRLWKSLFALFFSLLVAQSSLTLAVLVCHELVDDGVKFRFLVLVWPCRPYVFVDTLGVVGLEAVGDLEDDVAMWESPFLRYRNSAT